MEYLQVAASELWLYFFEIIFWKKTCIFRYFNYRDYMLLLKACYVTAKIKGLFNWLNFEYYMSLGYMLLAEKKLKTDFQTKENQIKFKGCIKSFIAEVRGT